MAIGIQKLGCDGVSVTFVIYKHRFWSTMYCIHTRSVPSMLEKYEYPTVVPVTMRRATWHLVLDTLSRLIPLDHES
jgi:hypothetical protein